MTTATPRWLAGNLANEEDEAFLADAIARVPQIERMFRRAITTPVMDRHRLITESMKTHQDPLGQMLSIPPLWHTTPQGRSDERAWLAEFLAPTKLRNPHQAAEWARIDDGVKAVHDSVTTRADVQMSSLSKAEQERLATIMTDVVLSQDRTNARKVQQHISQGDSQLARWVGDTGRLQGLSHALRLEAEWPDKKAALDPLWISSGGGAIRSEMGQTIRRKLIFERQDLHRGVKTAADFVGDKVMVRLVNAIPEKHDVATMVAKGDPLTTPVLRWPKQFR